MNKIVSWYSDTYFKLLILDTVLILFVDRTWGTSNRKHWVLPKNKKHNTVNNLQYSQAIHFQLIINTNISESSYAIQFNQQQKRTLVPDYYSWNCGKISKNWYHHKTYRTVLEQSSIHCSASHCPFPFTFNSNFSSTESLNCFLSSTSVCPSVLNSPLIQNQNFWM